MALYRRGSSKVWWVDLTLPDGKRIRETTKTENKQLAQEFHDKLKTQRWMEQRLGVNPDIPFEKATAMFRTEKEHIRDSCKKSYEFLLVWWEEQFKGMTLRDITQERIITTINKKKQTGVTPATCNRHLAVLRGVLRLACHKYQWIERVPKFFLFEEPRCRVRWLNANEVGRLLDALPDHIRPMAALSLATGLRQSNVFNLRWSQVDLSNRVIRIEGDEMKNKNEHVIPLSDIAVEVIRQQIGKHEDAVFTYLGRPVKVIANKTWKDALKRAGLEDFRWHDMRHTWATTLVQNGVPEGVLQVLGAWETPAMVKKYAHHATESVRPFVGVADKALAASGIGKAPELGGNVHRLVAVS